MTVIQTRIKSVDLNQKAPEVFKIFRICASHFFHKDDNILVQISKLSKNQLIGRALRASRIKCKWSQNQLALLSEVDRNYISLIEQGKSSPSIRMLFRLCLALDITPSDLLKGVEKSLKEALFFEDNAP